MLFPREGSFSGNDPSVIAVHTYTGKSALKVSPALNLQEWGAPTVGVVSGFGYDCSWEKAEENSCSLGLEAGNAADGWEESCCLHAQGAWTALTALISVPALTLAQEGA